MTNWAGALGFNRIRVRWKLDKLRRNFAHFAAQTKGKAAHVRYAHKVCPYCHAVNDVEAKNCARCERPLIGRTFQILSRVGILTPSVVNISSLLGMMMVIIYARVTIAAGGGFESIFSMDTAVLFKHGASFAGAYHHGEWYRLLTSVFLHLGIWHIGFNLFALSQLGPFVEQIFGKARMIFYFVITGIAASLGSLLVRAVLVKYHGGFIDMSVAIGASGALMGLMGVMAGWGHRDGTSVGRRTRNMALKWALYTMVFGYFIGADNGAHGAGFLLGGVIGLSVNLAKADAKVPSPLVLMLSALSLLLVFGAFLACLVPMPSKLSEPFQKRMDAAKHPSLYAENSVEEPDPLLHICTPLRAFKHDEASAEFLVTFSPNILMSNTDIEAMLAAMCGLSPTEASGGVYR